MNSTQWNIKSQQTINCCSIGLLLGHLNSECFDRRFSFVWVSVFPSSIYFQLFSLYYPHLSRAQFFLLLFQCSREIFTSYQMLSRVLFSFTVFQVRLILTFPTGSVFNLLYYISRKNIVTMGKWGFEFQGLEESWWFKRRGNICFSLSLSHCLCLSHNINLRLYE